ncbi:hypothetical protein FOL47_010587 [Perkinsus chesapeaki]|uniref:PB1 domain-containing protein n=1 Tax=Perkinsus chesapeaki TaxID=330153 RepID=A0A7J6MPD6_PERCH|nr:hypothetical protein FOL47_010587 [Perkinsus chesapeaki]
MVEIVFKFHYKGQKSRRLMQNDSPDNYKRLAEIVRDQWPELARGQLNLEFTYLDDVGDKCLFHRDAWRDAVELARRGVIGTLKFPTVNVFVDTFEGEPVKVSESSGVVNLSGGLESAPKRPLDERKDSHAKRGKSAPGPKKAAAKSSNEKSKTKKEGDGNGKAKLTNKKSASSPSAEAEVVMIKDEPRSSTVRRSSRLATQGGIPSMKREIMGMLD